MSCCPCFIAEDNKADMVSDLPRGVKGQSGSHLGAWCWDVLAYLRHRHRASRCIAGARGTCPLAAAAGGHMKDAPHWSISNSTRHLHRAAGPHLGWLQRIPAPTSAFPRAEHNTDRSHRVMVSMRWFPHTPHQHSTLLSHPSFPVTFRCLKHFRIPRRQFDVKPRLLHVKILQHVLNWVPAAGCIDSHRDNHVLKDNCRFKHLAGDAEARQWEPRPHYLCPTMLKPNPNPWHSRTRAMWLWLALPSLAAEVAATGRPQGRPKQHGARGRPRLNPSEEQTAFYLRSTPSNPLHSSISCSYVTWQTG